MDYYARNYRGAHLTLLRYSIPVRTMTMYAHDRVDKESNAELRLRTGADLVDTESHVAAEFAAAHNLPFAVLRAVSDGGIAFCRLRH